LLVYVSLSFCFAFLFFSFLSICILLIYLFAASTIRRQFEQANLEAMDESAEWRMKYDKEFEKNKQLQDEFSKVLLTC
jgi:hypothetical protein